MKHEQGQMVFVFRLQDGQATMDLDGKRKLTLDLEAVQTLPLGEDGRLSPEATAYMVQMTETVADGEVGRRADAISRAASTLVGVYASLPPDQRERFGAAMLASHAEVTVTNTWDITYPDGGWGFDDPVPDVPTGGLEAHLSQEMDLAKAVS